MIREGKDEAACLTVPEKDLADVYIGNTGTVDTDLTLPLCGAGGSTFTWRSSEERFIAPDGTVHRPACGTGNRKVSLTVTAVFEGNRAERSFEVTVLQQRRELVVSGLRDVVMTVRTGRPAPLPSVVIADCEDGRITTLPVFWEAYTPPDHPSILTVAGRVKEQELRARALLTYEEHPVGLKGPKQQLSWFSIENVHLLPGTTLYEYQQKMGDFLLAQDDDQMLYNFRRACGRSTKGAEPMTGWDGEDCLLKGHTTGHYLSGLALAYAATNNREYHRKIEYMVSELGKCQGAFAASGRTGAGFLSACDETQFDLLEKYTHYPEIWAPYYTLDKILAGLIDCFYLGQSHQALEIAEKIGTWIYNRLSVLPREQLDHMWALYIAGEFGGMIGTLVRLYRFSRNPVHLKAAQLFCNDKLFYPMQQGVDTLEDIHANQHIPQIIGAMELYTETGDPMWWEIADHFWDIVTKGHAYTIGGVGEAEMFHRAGSQGRYLTASAAESCASYNMLRLTGRLFACDPRADRMDYYENTLLNHILTSCSHKTDGGTTYFLPLCPGGRKEYSTDENTCCHGTGFESRFRFMEHIYAYNEQYVWINLWIDSVLAGDVSLMMKTNGQNKIKITCLMPDARKLRVRLPAWAGKELVYSVNGGDRKRLPAEEDGYVTLPEGMKEDTVYRIFFPDGVRTVTGAAPELVNYACGPYLLAGLDDTEEITSLPGGITPEEKPLYFRAGNLRMIPLCRVDGEAYHIYFKRENNR